MRDNSSNSNIAMSRLTHRLLDARNPPGGRGYPQARTRDWRALSGWATLGRVSRLPARPRALCDGPFLGSAAVAAGLVTKAQLRSTAWHQLFRGVYADARLTVDHELRIRGALLLTPSGMVIAGRSAAHLYGAPLAAADDEVTVAGSVAWGGRVGIRSLKRSLRPADIRTYQGIPVTTPLATAYELARSLPLKEAVVWLDALGHARALRPANLRAHCATHEGEPGWRRATQAIGLADPRAESPPESRVRLYLTLAGLPPPVPQYCVVHNGEFVARVDLAWPALKVALEYDGQWHADPGQLARDRRRIRELNALGWYVYPVTSADLHNPTALIAQVAAILAGRSR